MVLVGVELKTLVSEPDALTTRSPPCGTLTLSTFILFVKKKHKKKHLVTPT